MTLLFPWCFFFWFFCASLILLHPILSPTPSFAYTIVSSWVIVKFPEQLCYREGTHSFESFWRVHAYQTQILNWWAGVVKRIQALIKNSVSYHSLVTSWLGALRHFGQLSEAQFLHLKPGNNNAVQNVVGNQRSQVCAEPGVEQGLSLPWLLTILIVFAVVKEKLVIRVSATTSFLQIVA